MSRRLTRLNEQLKREIAEIVRWEVADPRVGPATITGAEVAPDLTTARVYVALIGTPEERRETLQGLEAAAPFVRSQLADRLDLRRTPDLRFFPDDSIARASRIEELLAGVEPAGGWDAVPARGDAPADVHEDGDPDGHGPGADPDGQDPAVDPEGRGPGADPDAPIGT